MSEMKKFAIQQLKFQSLVSYLNRFMMLIHCSLVERDLCLVFEGNVIVSLFSEPFFVSWEAIVFLVNPYH